MVQTINPQHEDDLFGGFDNPLTNFLYYLFPSLKRNLHRTLTAPLAPVLFASDKEEVPPRRTSRLIHHISCACRA